MPAHRLLPAIPVLLAGVLTACGGGDLTLPGDRAPARLIRVSGDGQQGKPGEVLDEPLVVQLAGADGQPAPGAEVRFAGTAGGPQVDPAIDTTDGQGRATTRARLGAAEGDQAIEARAAGPGASLAVQFSVTALAIDKGKDKGGGHRQDD